jgi:hypothetical protein
MLHQAKSTIDPWALTLPIVLSVLALGFSFLSLLWQIISFTRSGARVKTQMFLRYGHRFR